MTAQATSAPPRPARPWLERLSLATGVIVVMAASVACAWGLRRYLHHSPRFAVAEIAVEGNHRLSARQLEKAAGIATGDNIFDLDEERARAKVLGESWVQEARVTKELPDVVRIAIVEREPRVACAIDGKLLLVDTKGILFKEAEAGDPLDLPVVTGIAADDVAKDREGVTLRLRRAIELLADLEQEHVAERLPIQELHVSAEGDVTVFAGTQGVALVFGQPPYRAKVDKAKRIMTELRARQAQPDVFFLDNKAHPERVVVRMRSEGASGADDDRKRASR